MVEIGKRYKLKKIKAPFLQNDESDYQILDIYGRMVACQNVDTGERFTFVDDMFVTDPNDDVYGELKPVVECGAAAACCPAATAGGGGATGAAPCPALGHVQGTMVNGVPVEGKSVKKKKKKSKKNEASFSDIVVEQEDIDNFGIPENEQKDNLYGFQYNKEYDLTPYFHFTILNKELNEDLQELSVSELIEEVQETFAPNDILTTTIEDNRQKLIISVYYTNPEDRVLTHSVKIEYLDPITDVKLDEEITEDLTIQEVVDIINYIAYNHLTESINEDAEDVIDDIVDVLDTEMERVSNFKEKYEEIADLLSKQLDRMNFEFANTEDIIYKKEGSHKYLLKFDNENGVLKFKVNKDDDTIFDKEWKLEEGEDISPIFTEIENIYKQYGI